MLVASKGSSSSVAPVLFHSLAFSGFSIVAARPSPYATPLLLPQAERRLDRPGFVAMTSLPVTTADGAEGAAPAGAVAAGGPGAADGGSAVTVYEPALPVPDLEGIYDRIVAQVGMTPG